jgi:glutamate--cysteine ligase
VRLGTLDESFKKPTEFALPDGSALTVEPLVRNRGRVGLKDFDPCTILLNNDLSSGIPRVLEHVHEQYLLPPLHAGWALRRKTNHFAAYEEVAKKFAKLLGMDPWLINPMYTRCGEVVLSEPAGVEALLGHAETLLAKIKRKYKEYGIQEKPFVIVKADSGTYGMGVMTVRDPKDIAAMEPRTRAKMSVQRDGQEVSELLLQEGVPTYERVNDAAAEPVVYMIDRYVVGGFYRVNAERGIDENLNAPGASFVPLAFAGSNQLPKPGGKPGASAPNRFYMYGVVARLAMVAASYELESTDPDAEVYE